jgi:hypothetical protein
VAELAEQFTVTDLNPQGKQMADESMVRCLDAQARAIWPQEMQLIRRYALGRGSVRAEDGAPLPARTEPRPARPGALPKPLKLRGIRDSLTEVFRRQLE